MRAWGKCVLIFTVLVAGMPVAAATPAPAPSAAAARVMAPRPVAARDVGAVPGAMATRIHWTRWTRRLVYGASTVLQGQVVTEDGALPDAEVDLYARRAGARRWRLVDTAVSSSDTAVFAFAGHEPSAVTDYRVVFDGDVLYAGTEATRPVRVARRVRDVLRRLRGDRYALRGWVAPRYRHRRIVLQRQTCRRCAWSTVAAERTSGRSRWRFRLTGPTGRGTWHYRAVVPRDGRFVRSYGDHVWVLRRR